MKTNLRNFRFAIFDVEGTLIKNKWLVFLKLIVRLNKGNWEFCLSWTGTKLLLPRPFQRFLCRFPKLNYCLDILLLGFLNLIDRGRRESYEGAKDFLLNLTKMGFSIFASSGNNTEKAREILEKAGLIDYFVSIIGFEKIPKSEHIPYFAKILGLPVVEFARSCLYFGDSPSDIIIAKRWEVYPIGVKDSTKPTLLLRAGAKEIINFLEV